MFVPIEKADSREAKKPGCLTESAADLVQVTKLLHQMQPRKEGSKHDAAADLLPPPQ